MYQISCRDDKHQFLIQSTDKDEVMRLAQEHLKITHHSSYTPQDLNRIVQTV